MIKESLKKSIVYEWYDSIRTMVRVTGYKIRSPKTIISKKYKDVFGKEMNWDNPRDLNEKINWLKLNSDTRIWTELSDKYRVREYVKEKGLEGILVPLYAKWDNADSIDFSCLPNSFVLKTNHGSGDAIIVRDKNKDDLINIKKKIKHDLNHKFGYEHIEPHYLSIKPCVIAEKLLEQTNDPWTSSIVDYKFWCFNGKPHTILTCFNRSKDGLDIEEHDLNWGYHPEQTVFSHHFRDGKGIVPRPKCLSQMIEIATKLSEGFPQVRVDLYEIDGNVYFGELTFTSNGGFMGYFTQDFLDELGGLVII